MTEKKPPSSSGLPRPGMGAALRVYADRRAIVMLLLGFSAGLPNLLIFDTLSAWLRESGLSLEVIGFFSLATLAYSFKFLWAPLVDRTKLPWLDRILGHRRSWMLLTQVAIVLGLWAVAGTDPAKALGGLALLAVIVGFCSATQDIVIDAWRIESAEGEKQGALAATYQWGYRIAMIVAGAVPLILAEHRGWSFSYAIMAGLMGIGMIGVLLAPREREHAVRPIHAEGIEPAPAREALEWVVRLSLFGLGAIVLGSGLSGNASLLRGGLDALGAADLAARVAGAWTAKPWGVWLQLAGVITGGVIIYLAARPLPRLRTRPGAYLSHALGEPLVDFFSRYGRTAALILALICVYRLSDFVLNIMNPFYLDLGFTKIEIAEVRKVFGVAMSMLGVFAGGLAIARWGLMRSMVAGAFAGPITNLVFAWLATRGHDVPALFVAIGSDNVASGFAGTCLIAYMSSLTGSGFTATQYALFSSLYSLPGKLVASQSGRIVEAAARSADGGGLLAPLTRLFGGMPSGAFAEGAAGAGVSPVALGAGYVAFFGYSCLIGIAGVVLALVIARREGEAPG